MGNVRRFCLLLFFLKLSRIHAYTSFQDPLDGVFGLVDENNNNKLCLYFKFNAKLYNFNLNNTDIATEIADFTTKAVNLDGYCAIHNEIKKNAQIRASWKQNQRRKNLKLIFQQTSMKLDEIRWELAKVVYSERFKDKSVTFQSANGTIMISAPLNQKFVCKDRINITLKNPNYENIILEFLPEIDVQPVNTGSGFGSNSRIKQIF